MNSSLSQTLYRKFLALDCEVQGHIHAGLRSVPLHNKTYVKWHAKKLKELQDARDAARTQWRDSVKDEPQIGYKERTLRNARGHEDLISTQAARRICARNGWNWESYEG